MSEDPITPTPPAWKNEKIRVLDNLFERYKNVKEEKNPFVHLSSKEREKLRNTQEYKEAAKILFAPKQTKYNIKQTIHNTLVSIEDEKALNEWIQQYLDQEQKIVPDIFINFFPTEFVEKLDQDTAQKLYSHLKQNLMNDQNIQDVLPGLVEKVKYN